MRKVFKPRSSRMVYISITSVSVALDCCLLLCYIYQDFIIAVFLKKSISKTIFLKVLVVNFFMIILVDKKNQTNKLKITKTANASEARESIGMFYHLGTC